MIYFVQAGAADGPVKIGKAKDVAARIATIAAGHYEVIAVLATLDVSDRYERKLHGLLKAHQINREWFRWCPEVAAVVEMAKAGRLPEFAPSAAPTEVHIGTPIGARTKVLRDAVLEHLASSGEQRESFAAAAGVSRRTLFTFLTTGRSTLRTAEKIELCLSARSNAA